MAAFRAGYNYGDTTEAFAVSYEVKPAPLPPGTYRNITGNPALAYGLIAASQRSGLPLFLGAYPITPASDILHELAKHKRFGVRTFQAEDEIAGIGAALGASFGGALGVTTSSGPGIALKSETIGLAVSLELPLVICDIQRGGPSTGLPTKTEQSDLLQAMFGRNGEAPVPVVAAEVAVGLLRRRDRGGADRADLPDAGLPALRRLPGQRLRAVAGPGRATTCPTCGSTSPREPNGPDGEFLPYLRDPETLARPWAVPGTPGLEHRIGGIEKADETGKISYDPDNHDFMVRTRQAKVDGIARSLPPLEVDDPTGDAKVLVLGWGSTYGPIGAACRRVRRAGLPVAQAHLRHLNPFPSDLGDVLHRYERVVVPEMNLGQLAMLLRARYLVDVIGYNQVRGLPFRAAELAEVFKGVITRCLSLKLTREGLQDRPGGPLVPRLRGLRDPRGGAGLHARARRAPGEHRVRLRDRLLVPLPVLHEHVRDALDPRPRAGDRDRAGVVPAGPVGLGGHR